MQRHISFLGLILHSLYSILYNLSCTIPYINYVTKINKATAKYSEVTILQGEPTVNIQ